jgi:hypothetical protein
VHDPEGNRGASRGAIALAPAMVFEEVVDGFVSGALNLSIEVVLVPRLKRQGVETVCVPGVTVADVRAGSERCLFGEAEQ